MASFGERDEEIVELAEAMIAGLQENNDIFPEPPFSPDEILDALRAFKHAAGDDSAAWDRLDYVTQKDLHYAEYVVDRDEEKLRLIGWNGQ